MRAPFAMARLIGNARVELNLAGDAATVASYIQVLHLIFGSAVSRLLKALVVTLFIRFDKPADPAFTVGKRDIPFCASGIQQPLSRRYNLYTARGREARKVGYF